jgi:hypothetical protein
MRSMRTTAILLALWVSIVGIWAQDDEFHLTENHEDTVAPPHLKSKKLGLDLKFGEFHFHSRSFFMGTLNRGDLSDYHTLATGAGMGYRSPVWKGFRFGFSGFFVFQVYEHHITEKDPITEAGNRYEILLYDMNDAENSHDLDRLEDLYLNYSYKQWSFTFGRQKINSPFLNEQDNRMRPNIFQGLTLSHKAKNVTLNGGFITHATLRGTVDWYRMSQSIGVYPFGRNPMGVNSSYKGNIESLGLGYAGLDFHKSFGKHAFSVQSWSYWAENLFHLQFLQSEYSLSLGKTLLELGVQGLFQGRLGNGGNPDPAKAYILPEENAMALGAKLGALLGKHRIGLNYLTISERGRFLFPREWGREHFYASLPRERFEGNGGVTALTLKYAYTFPLHGLTGNLGFSRVQTTHPDLYSLNKYGLPSYYHAVAGLDFAFSGYLQGLFLKALVVHKAAIDGANVSNQYRINRVDMWNFNLVVDFYF